MTMQEYAQKKSAFERATAERLHMIGKLHEATKAMVQSPELFHFSNCDGGFPPEVIMNRAAPTFDAGGWPSAQQIQSVLVRWHDARKSVLDAWRSLSQDEQRSMRPPE